MVFLKQLRRRHKHIGIIAPNNNILCRKIVESALSTLRESDDLLFEFSILQCDDDRAQLANKVDLYLNTVSFDALLTLGKSATQIAKYLTEAKRLYIPIVFGAVVDPVGNGLINSFDYTGNHLTGVSGNARDYKEQLIETISLFNTASDEKAIRRILVLYNPHTVSDIESDGLETLCNSLSTRWMEMFPVPFTEVAKIFNALSPYAVPRTIVMTLRDNSVTTNIKLIADICNRLRLPLFTSDLETTELGAAIGIGAPEARTGMSVGRIALDLLTQKKNQSFMSVEKEIWKLNYTCNLRAAEKQGLYMTQHARNVLRGLDCPFV